MLPQGYRIWLRTSQEEGIVPASAFDFAAQGRAIWVSSEDFEGEPAQNSKVLRSIVLSSTIAVLGEVNIEHPMELVLDTPVAAGDAQQPLGGDVLGPEIVAHDRGVGRAAPANAGAR